MQIFSTGRGSATGRCCRLAPTSYGDSPYQSFSTFAGNPYFIDLDMLVEDGLLRKDEIAGINWGTEPRYVDYGRIYESRFDVLSKAKERGWERDKQKVNCLYRTKQPVACGLRAVHGAQAPFRHEVMDGVGG